MKKIDEQKPVVGMLYTQFGQYELLDLKPYRPNNPWYIKDVVLAFHVRDGYGIGKTILVCGSFDIVPDPDPKVKPVTYFLDEEQVAHPEVQPA